MIQSIPRNPVVRLLAAMAVLMSVALAQGAAVAADRAKVQAFLKVTGYDVVIESLQHGAMAGPGMVGDAPHSFGLEYSKLAEKIFDPKAMTARALDILVAVMPDDLVNAGADFYASDLGQRLVAVENESHMADGIDKYNEGAALLAAMRQDNPARLDLLKGMDLAIGSAETSRRAVVEIQLRFMLAAMAAGAAPQTMSEDDLREILTRQAEENAPQTELFGLISNAYTYRDISDADLAAYVASLETPEMQSVYEILNATQFQVMLERYQLLGARLGELKPQQEL